jgi:glycosyltransferase involved in cell wall biosynthesis
MKVLFVQNVILHYRVSLYNKISEFCDLTVAHSGKRVKGPIKFNEVILNRRKINGFVWQTGIKSLVKDFNVVILMFDLKWLSTLDIILFNKSKSQKIFLWGIGVSSQNGLNKKKTFDFIRFWIAKKSSGLIFYSDYPKRLYESSGISTTKLYTAHNTIEVNYDKKKYFKKFNYFLFIGTLDARKKVDHLIDAFALYKSANKKYKKLQIIGSGLEEANLKLKVYKRGLSEDIIFLGRITDQQTKLKYFEHAIAVISPGQAGLSVLESMAYGVPFITYKDAITGGEIFNIKNGKNGYLIRSINDLVKIMNNITNNKIQLHRLSQNAINHYVNNRTINHLANSFKQIIFKYD